MADITSHVRTVRQLLAQGYQLGAYQREYEWEDKQVTDLFFDLKAAFYSRTEQRGGSEYFLGPIVTKAGNPPWLVDGQQRLTTLSLLIAAIRHVRHEPLRFSATDDEEFAENTNSAQKGKRPKPIQLSDPAFVSFKLAGPTLPVFFGDDVRQQLIAKLEKDGFLDTGAAENAKRMEDAFKELRRLLFENFEASDVAAFLTWIADHVILSEIRAGKSHDDFAIFDAMNSRGRPLEPLSQFLGFLGKRIQDPALRETAQRKFKDVQIELSRLGKRQDIEFVRSWLAARCLNLPDAVPDQGEIARKKLAMSDMAKIDRETIVFAQRNADILPELGLGNASQFVEQHWANYGEIYARVKKAYAKADPELESLWFLSKTKFDLLLDCFDEVLLLAGCPPGSRMFAPRLVLTGQFLENIAARVAWLRISGDVTKTPRHRERLKYLLAQTAGKARQANSLTELANTLAAAQETLGFGFDTGREPKLTPANKTLVRALLARLSAFMDELNGGADGATFAQSMVTSGPDKFDIEHLMPAPFSVGVDEHGHRFRSSSRYAAWRQRLGALVILRGRFNQQMSDRPYTTKLRHYANNPRNALVMSLSGDEYLSSQLKGNLKTLKVSFPDATQLSDEIIVKRETALRQLANYYWGVERLRKMATALEGGPKV